LINNKI